MCMLSLIPTLPHVLYVQCILLKTLNIAQTYIFHFLIGFQNDVPRFKEVGGVGGAEAKLLPCQHTSYLSLSFETFNSIICYK